MPAGLYATAIDWNRLVKQVNCIEEYIKNSLQEKRSKWVNQKIAMKEIGCKKTKLSELRNSGQLHWRYAGKGQGIMLLQKSIEDYKIKTVNIKSMMELHYFVYHPSSFVSFIST